MEREVGEVRPRPNFPGGAVVISDRRAARKSPLRGEGAPIATSREPPGVPGRSLPPLPGA